MNLTHVESPSASSSPGDRASGHVSSFGMARWRWIAVLLCAAISLALYIVLLAIVPSLSWSEPSFAGDVLPWAERLTSQSLSELKEPGGLELHTATSARFLLVLLGLFAAYGLTLWGVAGQRSRAVEVTVFGAGAVFLVLQLMGPVMLSSDIIAYAIYGRIFALYQGNPYSDVPALDPGDPYLPLWGMDYLPSWYGPLWTLVSAGPAWLGGDHIGLTVLLFRGIAVAAGLAAALLLWACLRRMDPDRAALGLVFFLWNPFVVLETGLSGHNDIVMMMLLLLGLWLHTRNRRLLAVIALILSALVKFVTIILLPLYVFMVLRALPTRHQRIRYLASGAACAVTVVLLVSGLARTGTTIPAVEAGASAEFYNHNLQELAFKGLRLWLGEDRQTIDAPVWFQGWWVETVRPTELWLDSEPSAGRLERIEAGTTLLVLAPQKTEWVWAYDPGTAHKGYVDGEALVETERPAAADTDPVLAQLAAGLASSPPVVQANVWLRLATWIPFALIWLVVAWRTTDLRRLVIGSTVIMLAYYWLIGAYFWPWYVMWALVLAALVPSSPPSRLVALLSATVLSLYVSGGYQGSAPDWIYTYRSVPAFVLPVLLLLLSYPVESALRSLASRRWVVGRTHAAPGRLRGWVDRARLR